MLRGDPRGLAGRRLGLDLHLLTCAEAAVANLAHCLDRADLDLLAPVSTPLASGLAALSAEERDDGAAVLDLGAAVTSVGLFVRNRLVFADALRVGGEQATLDVARVLGIDIAEAERLKTLEGSVIDLGTERLAMSEAAEYGAGRPPTRAELTAILRPRIAETMELARDRLAQAGFAYLPTPRLVLAGGGAEMAGALDLARKIFGRSVRLARPPLARGGDPAFAGPAFSAIIGLGRYAMQVQPPGWGKAIVKKSKPRGGLGGLFQWLRDTW
jgi:cell division protein FtsA